MFSKRAEERRASLATLDNSYILKTRKVKQEEEELIWACIQNHKYSVMNFKVLKTSSIVVYKSIGLYVQCFFIPDQQTTQHRLVWFITGFMIQFLALYDMLNKYCTTRQGRPSSDLPGLTLFGDGLYGLRINNNQILLSRCEFWPFIKNFYTILKFSAIKHRTKTKVKILISAQFIPLTKSKYGPYNLAKNFEYIKDSVRHVPKSKSSTTTPCICCRYE